MFVCLYIFLFILYNPNKGTYRLKVKTIGFVFIHYVFFFHFHLLCILFHAILMDLTNWTFRNAFLKCTLCIDLCQGFIFQTKVNYIKFDSSVTNPSIHVMCTMYTGILTNIDKKENRKFEYFAYQLNYNLMHTVNRSLLLTQTGKVVSGKKEIFNNTTCKQWENHSDINFQFIVNYSILIYAIPIHDTFFYYNFNWKYILLFNEFQMNPLNSIIIDDI